MSRTRQSLRAAVSRAGRHPSPASPRDTAILDGEIAVLDDKGVSQFHLIQPRICQYRPEQHRPPGAVDPGRVLRLRPAVPGRLRSAECGSGEAAGAARSSRRRRAPCCASPRRSPARARRCSTRRGRTGWKAFSPSMRAAATNRAAAATGSRSSSSTSRNSSSAATRSRRAIATISARWCSGCTRMASCTGWATSARASTRRR